MMVKIGGCEGPKAGSGTKEGCLVAKPLTYWVFNLNNEKRGSNANKKTHTNSSRFTITPVSTQNETI